MKLFTICLDIGRWTQEELMLGKRMLEDSLEKFNPNYELIIFSNFLKENSNEKITIREYYDNNTHNYYEGDSQSEWLNMSLNKLYLYRDLYEETGEDYAWIDLDTLICADLSYLEELNNYFIGTGGEVQEPHPLFVDNPNYQVPYSEYIQGNFWKLNIQLFHNLEKILEDLKSRDLTLQYDCQSLFNYVHHYLDYSLNILGYNTHSENLYGLGPWSKEDFTITQIPIFDLVFEKGKLFFKDKPENPIHIWSFVFHSFLPLLHTKAFQELKLLERQPEIYAFYRILYGEDFIKESLNSILPHVDKVFIFWTDKFFGDVSEVVYKGELVKFPQKIDNVIEVIKEMNNPKIELIYDHRPNNKNHFTERVNKYILPYHPKPKYILFLEPDFIYPAEDIKLALSEMQPLIKQGYYWFSTSQIEYWKSLKYTVQRLGERYAAMWWYIKDLDEIPPTGFHANVDDKKHFHWLHSRIHNLGFCVSDNAMFWKHMGSLAYSNLINDAFPNEMWYEEKWKDWVYDHNGKNYEISLGQEHMIPFISISNQFDWLDLPEGLLERLNL